MIAFPTIWMAYNYTPQSLCVQLSIGTYNNHQGITFMAHMCCGSIPYFNGLKFQGKLTSESPMVLRGKSDFPVGIFPTKPIHWRIGDLWDDSMQFSVFDYDFDKHDCLGTATVKGAEAEAPLFFSWTRTQKAEMLVTGLHKYCSQSQKITKYINRLYGMRVYVVSSLIAATVIKRISL